MWGTLPLLQTAGINVAPANAAPVKNKAVATAGN